MQTGSLQQCSDDVLYAIRAQLTWRDRLSLAAVNRRFSSLFSAVNRAEALLAAVVQGRESQSETLFKYDSSLLFVKRAVTDPAGRFFPAASAWQYALWVQDIFLLRRMLQYITPEQAPLAVAQFQQLSEVTWQQGERFDVMLLVNALRTLAESSDTLSEQARQQLWSEQIRALQLNLPVVYLQEFSRVNFLQAAKQGFVSTYLERRIQGWNVDLVTPIEWPLRFQSAVAIYFFDPPKFTRCVTQPHDSCLFATQFPPLPTILRANANVIEQLATLRQHQVQHEILQAVSLRMPHASSLTA